MADNTQNQEHQDDSPKHLDPAQGDRGKNSRKGIYVFLGIIIMLLGIFYFSLMSDGNSKKTDEPKPPPISETSRAPFVPDSDGGQGLVQMPAGTEEHGYYANEGQADGETGDNMSQLRFQVVNNIPETDPGEEARRREIEEIRRMKMQMSQAALISKMGVVKNASPAITATSGGNSAGSGGTGQAGSGFENLGGDYDVAADIDKEGFFQRADTTYKDGWVSPYTVEKGRTYEIKTGTVVPGTLVSGINSELPGNIIAQVSQNVYDTATGRSLLIPQGAKLFGVYDSRVAYGQSRVLVAWNRIVFPDGSSVTLGAMPGADIAGFSGYEDIVNNHYLRIFGSAALMSIITGGMSYAVDEVSNSNNNDNSTTVQDEMAAALANQMGQTTLTLLQKNLSIAPTLEIRQGFQFNIIITKDVVFPNAYNGR